MLTQSRTIRTQTAVRQPSRPRIGVRIPGRPTAPRRRPPVPIASPGAAGPGATRATGGRSTLGVGRRKRRPHDVATYAPERAGRSPVPQVAVRAATISGYSSPHSSSIIWTTQASTTITGRGRATGATGLVRGEQGMPTVTCPPSKSEPKRHDHHDQHSRVDAKQRRQWNQVGTRQRYVRWCNREVLSQLNHGRRSLGMGYPPEELWLRWAQVTRGSGAA